MKNLEQIRASNALAYTQAGQNTRGKQGGNVLNKLPALIMANGLMAAGAFAYAQKLDTGWASCFDYIARHLAHREIELIPSDCQNLKALMDFLANKADSQTLKLVTAETLAWLSFARRFEPKKPKSNSGDKNDSTS